MSDAAPALPADDLVAEFVTEARELIEAAAEDLLALDGAPGEAEAVNRVFRAFHTLKGAAALFGWPAMLAVLHAAEDGLSAARAGTLATGSGLVDLALAALDATARWTEAIAAAGAIPAGAEAESARLVERFRALLASEPRIAPGGEAGPAPDWAADLLTEVGDRASGELTAVHYRPRPDCFFAGDDPLGLVRRLPGLLALRLAPAAPWPPVEELDVFACNLAVTLLTADPRAEVEAVFRLVRDQVTIATLAAPKETAPSAEAAPRTGAEAAPRAVRVEAGRIDALVALAEDLAAARSLLGDVVARAASGTDLTGLVPALRASDERIGRLAAELHREAVGLRLQPLARIFRRFPRALRDIARQLGKEVTLTLEGEEIEVDRDGADGLFEPLLHLLRNAVDHGIEEPAARARAGKPAAGRIVLRAEGRGERVVVSVSDDGRGLDPAFIRRRAAERGLMPPAALAALDEAGLIDLIFAPGFSTAAEVGAVSGRGVGMDAVRAALRHLGGGCTVESRAGHGTTVHLVLPRAQSLARLLLVEVGPELYGLPMEAVAEVARVPRERIRDVGPGAATVLRDCTVPVFRLADLLAVPADDAPAADGPRSDAPSSDPSAAEARLAVLRSGGDPVAVEVDRFAGRLDALVRPLPGLAALPGLAGTTLTGDGRVILVLDPDTLIDGRAGEGTT
ncbi:chemotaxis protein CheA [Methylobacterium nonmethylotrophicum]|uniref:Chemotaxis protein CheA n=1 Tax=Methylobacterium nonmethylotrophicum TaxID=1141884 RepID=A0A4Z0NG08_9HYPH|nr:chemotaxis protein CheA [Methylobacterium nonmethylotrophicum]TGD95132.1 chemotaxis protein CheA [Methylobacterium nonmethylotrophicum]